MGIAMELNKEVLSAREAADLLGAHVETIRRMARKGSLPAYKLGKDWRFNKRSLLRWSQTGPALQKKATILSVDGVSDPDERARMRHFLENAGYRIVSVADGKEGLVWLREHAVDLAVLNLTQTGTQASSFIREACKVHPQLPIVIVTDGSEIRLVMDTNQSGPFILVSKPMEQATVVSAVQMILEGTLSNQQAPQ
jgi:excisionase family DNA binding protein